MPKGKIKMSVTNPNAGPDDSKKNGKGKFYAGGPGFKELNPKKPKPNVTSEQGDGKKKKRIIVPGKRKIGPANPVDPRKERQLPRRIKSGDMGTKSRNQKFPSRNGGR